MRINRYERHKTRRQRMGMPDRWRLLERLDPTVMVILRSHDDERQYSSCTFTRQSELQKLRLEYGNDMEVL